MTRDQWIATHPYLNDAADFHGFVESTVKQASSGHISVPSWREYASDFQAGVPVLRSASDSIDLDCLSQSIGAVLEKLISGAVPQQVRDGSHALSAELRHTPDALPRATAWLLDRDSFQSLNAGLFWFVGWTVLAQHLTSLVTSLNEWRDEEQWLRNYCPVCGSLPAMAQIAGADTERVRLLSCGCCRCRWRYRRTGCPFCEETDDRQLMAVVIEGERELRIDYCKACGGYIKTYIGNGNEDLLLADWSSVHLDLVANDRGLKRYARSLYDVPCEAGTG